MIRYTPDHTRRRGAALMVALFLLAVFGIGSGALLRHLHLRMEQSSKHGREVKAHYLAEAGVEKAIAMLQAPGSSYRGETMTPLGEGYFSVAVTAGEEAGRFTLEARGMLITEGMGDAYPLEQRIRGEARITAQVQVDPQGRIQQVYWNEGNG